MGLLDDAIREHLELKRLRGADPGEVAREQQEALEPTVDAAGPVGEQAPAGGQERSSSDDKTTPVAAVSDQPSALSPEALYDHDATTDSQETAELDMQSELDSHGHEERHQITATGSDAEVPAGEHGTVEPDDPNPLDRELPRDSSS